MPNQNDLAFMNPVAIARPGRMNNMSPQLRPNLNVAGTLAEDIGAGNYGNAFDTFVDVAGTTVGIPRGVGAATSRTVRTALSGFQRGRQQRAQTATNATRGGGAQQQPPRATGSPTRPDRRRRDNDRPSGGKGGNALIVGNDTPNLIMPVIKGHLSTIEGGPLPTYNQTEDYVSQLHVANYSLATWWDETSPLTSSPKLYNPDSIKSKQVHLVFGRLLNDLFKEVTTKFTDDFTEVNFRKYIHTFIQALELIAHVESVLSYNSKVGYADKFIANEFFQEVYSEFTVIDALKRLKTVLKNKNFPPKLTALIFSIYQLYKMQNLEQSANFRFIPLKELLLDEDSYPGGVYPNFGVPRNTIINSVEQYITILTSRDMTLVSKAIGFIRPNYTFSVPPLPNMAAQYNPDMVELLINLPRLYNTQTVAPTVVNAYPQPTVGEDRPYVIAREVDAVNTVIFALQSQPATRDVSSVGNNDYTNFGSTFASEVKYGGKMIASNVFSLVTKVISGRAEAIFEPESVVEAMVSGKSYVVDFRNGLDVAPAIKYSITPSYCQRVYFNNTFAPTDAVRKLVDDVLDMN